MTAQFRQQADIHVTREKALHDYLALGSSRSLKKLIQHYTNHGLKAPALSTLKGWSSAMAWQAQAADYDKNVENAAHNLLVQKQANKLADETFDVGAGINEAFRQTVFNLKEGIKTMQVNTVADLVRLTDIGKELIELDRQFRDSQLAYKCKTQQQRQEEVAQSSKELFAKLEKEWCPEN